MKYEQAWCFGLGDYFDILRGTARKHIKSYAADNDSFSQFDEPLRRRDVEFYHDYLKPIEKKIILLMRGNHSWDFADGTNETQHLAQLCKTFYGDVLAGVRLRIQCQFAGEDKTLAVLTIRCHHGDWSGGYTRTGSDYNAMEMKSVLGFSPYDIFAYSHTHRKGGFKVPHLGLPKRGELKELSYHKAFIRSGCFMTGYPPKACSATYAERQMLAPTELGHTRLEIQFFRDYDPARYRRQRDQDGRHNGAAGNWQYEFKLHF
jgi:hypothetical protein